MNYKTYIEYKQSNISWAEDIPSHWKISKLKRIFQFEKGKNSNLLTEEYVKSNEGQYPVYSGQTRNKGILGYINSYEYDFENNVILVTTVGAKAMTTFLIRGKLSLSQNCALIKINSSEDLSDYYYYLCKILFNYERGLIPDILQPSLRIGDLNTYNIIKPPLNEQKQIADYLNKKIAEIDEIVSKNQQLITLLEEKRNSLIYHIVTRGLNPNVALKEVGIEWIGEIPEHWDMTNLNHVSSDENYSFVDGPFGSDLKNEEYIDEGIPIIQLNNIKVGNHDFTNEKFISEKKYNQLIKHSIKPGNIVIAKMAEPVARATIVSDKYDKYTIVADCIKLACNSNFSNRYVTYSLNSYIYHEAVQKATGTTRIRINLQEMKKLKILMPPLNEQDEISNFLDNETSIINKTIQKIQENIDLLEEYKTSLIHHAVTGKIDVTESR